MNLELFQEYRPLLFAIAYRMLGTVADAEDVLQDAWLRVQSRAAELIENPKYYLTTVVTRLCLNQLSLARNQRERYLGPWLPEPILTETRPELLDPLDGALIGESISIAFLVVLESLSPVERAVFLLHEVFGYKFREIGGILEKSESACRQLLRRAKAHLAANRPRFDATPEQHQRFLQLLADDVTIVPDGGGEHGAAIRILHGREPVSAFILGTHRISPPGVTYTMRLLNGQAAILARTADGKPFYSSPDKFCPLDTPARHGQNFSGYLYALFLYLSDERVRLIHVIAGRKLQRLDTGYADAIHSPSLQP